MVFHFPTQTEIANGIINELGTISRPLGDKALLVTGKNFLDQSGLLNPTMNKLAEGGIDIVHYSEVQSNPTDEIIDEAISIANQQKCNLVIGFGGGSVLDTAKMVSVGIGGSEKVLGFF